MNSSTPRQICRWYFNEVIQPENVVPEKAPEILRRGRDAVKPEKFAGEAGIGASAEPDFIHAFRHLEFRGNGFAKCARAGAARVNERAVNVEQNEPDHTAQKLNGNAPGGNALFRDGGARVCVGAMR